MSGRGKKQPRADGYQSAVLGNVRHYGRMQAETDPLSLYLKGGLFARICDKPADDALSAGIGIENDTGALKTEMERLDVQAKLADALRLVRITGGACLMPLFADGASLDEEAGTGAVVEEIRVFGAHQVQAYGSRYNDPKKTDYGRPVRYTVNTRHGSFTVHESRIIPLACVGLVDNDVYWHGRPAVSAACRSVLQWLSALEKAGAMLERKQQAVYKMAGLSAAVEQGFEEDVQKRIALVDTVRGFLNTVAVDGADDYSIIDLSLGGLTETLNEFKEQLAADSGIPVSVLFGKQGSGLSGSHDGELKDYYDTVQLLRANVAQPALEKLLERLAAQPHIKAAGQWRIVWPPLFKPNAKEQAEIAKTEAETWLTAANAVNAAVQTGALSEAEARAFLQSRGLFGLIES